MTTITITGVDGIMAVLEQLDGKDRQNLERRAVRAASKPFIAAFKEVAASHQSVVPASFLKVPAAKVSASMRRGGSIMATVRPKSPLFNIFEPGAKRHTIAPRRGAVMGGPAGSSAWDSKGRKRSSDFFSSGPVEHPGMGSRAITPAAFALGEPAAMDAFTAVILGSVAKP